MQTVSKVLCISILTLFSIKILQADNFISQPSKQAPITPLSTFDKIFQQERQKYPNDSVFFVDGRTGKIVSVNRLPKTSKQVAKPIPRSTQKPTQKIPYEMQEERIELLR